MKTSSRYLKLITLFIITSISSGCADLMKIQQMSSEIASGDPYPNDSPAKDVKLVPFVKDSVEMGIPVGWKSVSVRKGGDLNFKFTNNDGSSLLVFCYGMFVHRNALQQTLQNVAKAAVPNSIKTTGMYELEVSGLNPRFELYRGSRTTKGVPVSLDINIAWRVNDRFSGCKYGLVYIAPTKQNKQNEYEFLSIVRSLR